MVGDQSNELSAAAWPVTSRAIRMGGVEPIQDPSSVQEIVDQSINSDQLHANVEPSWPNLSGANQNVGQAQGQHFVRNPVDIAQWLDQVIDAVWTLARSTV